MPVGHLVASASEIVSVESEEKVYSAATIEQNFADDRVLVVLNNKTSLPFNDYTVEDFSDVELTNVTSLMDLDENQFAESETSNELSIYEEDYHQILSLELKNPGKENVLSAINELKDSRGVYYVGPDYIINGDSTSTTPNDYNSSDQWAIAKIRLPEAWSLIKSTEDITVGVIDSGIDGTHEDLKDRIDTSLCYDFTSGSAVAVSEPTDPSGHGTHVAGIIGATGNNGTGITGTCWNVNLVSLRVLDDNQYGYLSNFITALKYASCNGIKILNCSVGWQVTDTKYCDTDITALSEAVANYSGLMVCSAGNDNIDTDVYTKNYPSDLDAYNVISVGNSDKNDKKAKYSNYGATTVDLFAPGEGIYSTLAGGGYGNKSGTSMAAPFVTGVAALILSYNPNLTVAEIKNIILNNVDTSSSLSGLCVTGGRLNAYKALSSVTHSHSYTADYVYSNTLKHKSYCVCGSYTLNNHYTNADNTWTSGGHEYAKCLACGFTICIDDTYIEITKLIGEEAVTISAELNIISSTEQLMQTLNISETEANGEYAYIFDIYDDEFFEERCLITGIDIYGEPELLLASIESALNDEAALAA